MKWNFTMILIVHLLFLLMNGVVTNAQSSGHPRNYTTTVNPTRIEPTTSTSFIKATNSRGNSNMQPNSNSTTTPTHGATTTPENGYSYTTRSTFLGIIIAGIAGAVSLVAVVITIYMVQNYVRRRKLRSKRETVGPSINLGADDSISGERRGEMDVELCHEPEHFVAMSKNVSIKRSELAKKRRITLGGGHGRDQSDIVIGDFDNDLEEKDVPKSDPRRSKTLSIRPGLVKKIITVNGGVMKIDDIVLEVSPGCLDKDTEITLIKDDQNPAFKSLLDLGLVKAVPRVVEFLPDGLKFLKPANLSIKYEKIDSDAELCILHGSYNRDYQRTVWELVTNDIEDNTADGVVNMKINGFCFFGYIFAERGMLSRILSHLNQAFTCRAYSLYRRVPFMDTFDIVVVLLSEFIDSSNMEDIQQLKHHFDDGYLVGEKGALQLVHTDRLLELSLDFPGVEKTPFALKLEVHELDYVGFVTDHFKGTDLKYPAFGMVKVYEKHRTAPSKLLWKLGVREMDEEVITTEKMAVQMSGQDEEGLEQVVFRPTKLTNTEITRISRVVGVDWDSLAGLLDIPYPEREEIRLNNNKYPDSYSKAEQIFAMFSGSRKSVRYILEKFGDEFGRRDEISKMLLVETEDDGDDNLQPLPPPALPYENVVLRNTPLSPREMFKLSRKIVLDWDSLAGLMDIAHADRQNVRLNRNYEDDRARAEKILSLINHQKDFSRDKLADGLKGIERIDLIRPIETGQWRSL